MLKIKVNILLIKHIGISAKKALRGWQTWPLNCQPFNNNTDKTQSHGKAYAALTLYKGRAS